MHWTDKVIESLENLMEVGLLIDEALIRVHNEITEAYEKTDRLDEDCKKDILPIGMFGVGAIETITIDYDEIKINHYEVCKRILDNKGTLSSVSIDEVYLVMVEMILEQIEPKNLINCNLQQQQTMLRDELEVESRSYKQQEEMKEILASINQKLGELESAVRSIPTKRLE